METVEDLYAGIARYRSLGLLANPFVQGRWGEPSWIASEAESEGNRLVASIMGADDAGDARPLWVAEPDVIDDDFFMTATSRAELMFANDPDLNALHAYVPLPAMRIGSIRSILGVVAERLVFREFTETLSAYVRAVLEEPDVALASYKVLGPERLATFAGRFEDEPSTAVVEVFGDESLERQEEMSEVLDGRQIDAERLGDDEDDSGEIDESMGVAPGVSDEASDADAGEDADAADPAESAERMLLDYFIEYAAVHVSPVVARALRTYHERGQVAAAAEFKVTKAPSKTLVATVSLIRRRFDRVVIILGEFNYWKDVPEHLRHKIVGALTALRWSLGDSARIVLTARHDEAPELEETFGHGLRLEWRFGAFLNPPGPDSGVVGDLVDGWLAAAALPGVEPMTVQGSALSEVANHLGHDFERFIHAARAAVEDAADRGAATVDAEAAQAGMRAASETVDSTGE